MWCLSHLTDSFHVYTMFCTMWCMGSSKEFARDDISKNLLFKTVWSRGRHHQTLLGFGWNHLHQGSCLRIPTWMHIFTRNINKWIVYIYICVTLHCYFNLQVWSCMFRTPYNLYIPILVSMQCALQKLYFHIGPVMMRNVLRWIFDVWLTVDSWCFPALLHIHDMWSITKKNSSCPGHHHGDGAWPHFSYSKFNTSFVSLGFWGVSSRH